MNHGMAISILDGSVAGVTAKERRALAFAADAKFVRWGFVGWQDDVHDAVVLINSPKMLVKMGGKVVLNAHSMTRRWVYRVQLK